MIDALFGSKTRVKLLHLFLNHPGESFYVREITRLIGEQINSVRRELANMLNVGVIVSDSADNKLYYEVNQRYEYYVPLRAIFADEKVELPTTSPSSKVADWSELLTSLEGARIVVSAGVLVRGSASAVDLLVVGSVHATRLKNVVKQIEKSESREINYTLMGYDEFYYRLSVRDRFIIEILNNKHSVLVDTDNLLSQQK